MKSFKTLSFSQNHTAIINGVSSKPFKTEIDLVRWLSTQKIFLKDYNGTPEKVNDKNTALTYWELIK